MTVAGNSQLSYSPARNPDFVGTETFTYTIGDGLGGTDQAAVQVTVEGNGNYFVFDDATGSTEDPRRLTVPSPSGCWPTTAGPISSRC